MLIGGASYNIQPWPEPKTEPAITWGKGADGYPFGTDRGATEDRYLGTVRVAGPTATLDALQATLDANRTGITLSGFNAGEMLFGADVDYSGSISAAVVDFGVRRNVMMNAVHELEITLRAISPALLSTTPSLTGLRLQEGWSGDRSTDVNAVFAYGQSAAYHDHGTDAGVFKGRFLQTTESMKAIRAYLLTTARAEPIPFPNLFPVPFYPFGANEADHRFQMCVVRSWADKRRSLARWELEITFEQALPFFSGGTLDEEVDRGALFLTSDDDTPDYYVTPGG